MKIQLNYTYALITAVYIAVYILQSSNNNNLYYIPCIYVLI